MPEYFSHDFNSRNDPKMVSLFIKMGHEGHGLFWGLVELSYEQGGKLELSQCESYAFGLRTQCDKLKSIINDFNLFINDGVYFWSETILKRLNIRYDKSQKASNSAKIRWNNANALRPLCEGNARKEIKVKEIKEKNNTLLSETAERVYKLYPGKDLNKNGRSTAKCFQNKEKIMRLLKTGMSEWFLTKTIEIYFENCRKSESFLMNFSTFLNNLPDYGLSNEPTNQTN